MSRMIALLLIGPCLAGIISPCAGADRAPPPAGQDDFPDEQFPSPDFRWHGHAKSLYTPERYQKIQKAEEAKATSAEQEEVAAAEQITEADDEDEASPVGPDVYDRALHDALWHRSPDLCFS